MTTPRTWPLPNAVAALALFAIVIPVACIFFGLLESFSFSNSTPPDESAYAITRVWLVAGTVSAVIAIGLGLSSAIAGRGVAVRIVSVLAILAALVTGGFQGLLLLSEAREALDSMPDHVEPVPPPCGPESHPTVFGGDSRYQPCAADVATATEFMDTAVPQLPIENVTAASVDAVASGIEPEVYDGAHEYDNGDITVAWYPAPVTCVVATWRDGTWNPEVTGLLADGGCIYLGG